MVQFWIGFIAFLVLVSGAEIIALDSFTLTAFIQIGVGLFLMSVAYICYEVVTQRIEEVEEILKEYGYEI